MRQTSQRPILDLRGQWLDTHHRSGWPYAMASLAPLHHNDGIYFEGFIEKKFAWGHDPGDRYNEPEPHQRPWVGVLHNPPGVPDWFNLNEHAPTDILRTDLFRQSLEQCRGLFTLTRYLAAWLAPRVEVPVVPLLHPTEASARRFEMDAFLANQDRMVVQVGWWLRRYRSIFELTAPTFRKVILHIGEPWMETIMQHELALLGKPKLADSVTVMRYLPPDRYDELLSRNVVFLDLYDASANNAILECMVRATPVLVRDIEPVREYLGPHYPFYFQNLDEAAAKLGSLDAIAAAHRYLAEWPRTRELTGAHFLGSVAESELYCALLREVT